MNLIRHGVYHPGAIEFRYVYILIYIFVTFCVVASQYLTASRLYDLEKKRADATVTAVQGLRLLWPSLNDREFLDGTRHVIYPWGQSKI
ncbi:hypothetical protein [Microcoleus sp. N3A4]|uniref:hypothetical protein n=1 Tax=Microcoleus sp. N3A4 TaxID=3055379 RepID=UPI002FD1F9CA